MGSKVDPAFQGVAYQAQEEVYYDDGREIALLHFVYKHPQLEQMRGNPQRVLDAIDEYGKTQKYLMNIGPYKAKTVTELIAAEKPQVMVELGGYVGYSAIAFAAAVQAAGGKQYFSLEHNPEFAAVITMLADLAGLRDIVQVVVGNSADSLRRLHRNGELKQIDLLFLDHLKPAYTPDLKLCEELELVRPGSVYAADNVVKPGNPPYLKYVRSTVEQKKEALAASNDNGPQGNPKLVYESRFVEGWEPSGVPDALEITRCTGIDT
ncbi:catechol O-methyltransferase [Microdochium bolleyi]|uniref:catechol O-methyltransferase n=1 Tax=Microdochium bolleyi TaxID=196109 RepID=A0A136J0P7_9PEZI|nr:catechol O-methyltransferase [Microdochium bolleyi]